MNRLATTLAVLAATVVVSAPAHAATLALPDATGDVWTFDEAVEEVEPGEEALVPSRRQVNVDLMRTSVSHTPRAVVVKGRFVDLAKNRDLHALSMNIRSNEGRRFALTVAAGPHLRRGDATLDRRSGPVRCKGLQPTVNYDDALLAVRIPRSCLGSPRWVQVQGGAVSIQQTGSGGVFFDYALSAGPGDEGGWSAKVRRG